MPVERKCPHCKTWNKSNDFCTNCEATISPQQIIRERIKIQKQEEQNKTPSKIDLFLKKIKTSTNPLIKTAYYFLASIWAIYMFLLGIILYLSAVTNG